MFTAQPLDETIRVWDVVNHEYRTATVAATPAPKPRTRRPARRVGRPVDYSGLSSGSPLASWWRDTAYAPAEPLADMRTWTKQPAMRTRRPATIMPADPGQLTARKPSDRLDV